MYNEISVNYDWENSDYQVQYSSYNKKIRVYENETEKKAVESFILEEILEVAHDIYYEHGLCYEGIIYEIFIDNFVDNTKIEYTILNDRDRRCRR
jgi:hypothetical protein